METPNQVLMICITCKTPKLLTEFWGKFSNLGRSRPQCKPCIEEAISEEQKKPRTCTTCGDRKMGADFYVRSVSGGGRRRLARECKSCSKERSEEQRLSNHDEYKRKLRVYGKTRHAFLRDAVFSHYGGYRCACCGETEPKFLTLDHIENDGAEFRRMIAGKQAKGAGYRTYQWLHSNGFPPGYQVLCANCNYGKRMNKGVCPHQERRNDYPAREYGQAAGSAAHPSQGDEIVCSAMKVAAARA